MMFFETIRIDQGAAQYLSYHQERVNRTLATHFPGAFINLQPLLNPPGSDLFKCRIVYDTTVVSIEYQPYYPRSLQTLRLIHADDICYPFKSVERQALNHLFSQRAGADDILIVKNGWVTDTSIANIAFLKNGRWYTPNSPLLPGTTRARLLQIGFLTPAAIHYRDLPSFEACAVMNAMIGFLPITNGRMIHPKKLHPGADLS